MMSILRQEDIMKDLKTRYTLRVDSILFEKLGYVAEYEGRTKNRTIVQMIKAKVAAFEKAHGEITRELMDSLNK